MIRGQLKPAFLVFLALTFITGVFYPLAVTAVAQLFFKDRADGSLIYQNGKAVGSSLIGQPFDDPKYFWGRISATAPFPYNAASSSGSNLGPLNQSLRETAASRIKSLKDADPSNALRVPADLVTASGSGLDPHISLAGAYYQMPRVARTRGISEDITKKLIALNTDDRFLGVFGEPVVNVLRLNLSIDEWEKTKG